VERERDCGQPLDIKNVQLLPAIQLSKIKYTSKTVTNMRVV
ncbi:20822_t:CDS:1, partial [Racocetra persica]